MAKVIFDKSVFQRTYTKGITGRILLDLRADATKKSPITRDYENHTARITELFVSKQVAKRLDSEVRSQYSEAISNIQHLLKTGIDGSPTEATLATPGSIPLQNPTGSVGIKKWNNLNPRYYKAKGKVYKTTQNKFWVRRKSAGLSAAFGTFAGRHKRAVNQSKFVVTLNSRGLTAQGRAHSRFFRYGLTFSLPETSIGAGYLKDLLQISFVSGKAHRGEGHSLPENLAIMGYLEGTPTLKAKQGKEKSKGLSRHRPFIAALMANRGRVFSKQVDKLLKQMVKIAGG